jgi:hypothetical protein
MYNSWNIINQVNEVLKQFYLFIIIIPWQDEKEVHVSISWCGSLIMLTCIKTIVTII